MANLIRIKGYEDYLISDDGEVFSIKFNRKRKLKKRINKGGYYYVNLCKNGKYKTFLVHRLVGLYFVEKKDDSFTVLNHIDGNKLNNNSNNLEWCTVSHNSKEAIRLGLIKIKKGKDSNLYGRFGTKLNVEIANEIRKIRNDENLSYRKIAERYKISKATVINICKNRIYYEGLVAQ